MLIPFTTRIPEEQQDKHLEQKLRTEVSRILNWILEGTERWKKEKLKTPAIVLNATDEYKNEMDVIGNFIKECCVQSSGISIRIRELFKAYQGWCDEHNEHAVSERFLGLRLKEMGYEQRRTTEARYWVGIGLQNSS